MKRPSVFLLVVLMSLAACQGHTDGLGVGPHLELAMQSPDPSPLLARSGDGQGMWAPLPRGSEVMDGTNEVRAEAWAAVRGLTHTSAWLALGLRAEGERVRLLAVHAHEGTGAEVGAVGAEDFRRLLEWALYRYVRDQRGEVVLTPHRRADWRQATP